MNIWTLLTLLGDGSGGVTNNHPDSSIYGGTFTYVGTLGAQYVYAMCSLHKPADDSSGQPWVMGDPSVVAAGYVPSGNTIPICPDLEPCCDHVTSPIVIPTPVGNNYTGVDCAGLPLPTTANQSVFIAGTKTPVPVCIIGGTSTSDIDFEIGCSSINGRVILLIVQPDGLGGLTSGLYETDAYTPVIDGSVLVKCDIDYESIERCKTDGTNFYKMVTYFNTSSPASNFTIWLDSNNAIIPPVVGATDCTNTEGITSRIVCDVCTDSAEFVTDGWPQIPPLHHEIALGIIPTDHRCDPFVTWELTSDNFFSGVLDISNPYYLNFITSTLNMKKSSPHVFDVIATTNSGVVLHSTIEIAYNMLTGITSVTHTPSNPYTYSVTVSRALALVDAGGNIISLINPDGTTYTPTETISFDCPNRCANDCGDVEDKEDLDETFLFTQLECDDINGDGLNKTKYWRFVWVNKNRIIKTVLYNYELNDLYTPFGQPCDLNEDITHQLNDGYYVYAVGSDTVTLTNMADSYTFFNTSLVPVRVTINLYGGINPSTVNGNLSTIVLPGHSFQESFSRSIIGGVTIEAITLPTTTMAVDTLTTDPTATISGILKFIED